MPLLFLLALTTDARADHPPGARIDPAVSLDITPSAFDELTSIAAELIPASIAIPDVRLEGSEETCLIWCWNWYEYLVYTSGLDVAVNLDHFDLIPLDGRLRLDVGVDLNVASAQDPGTFYAFGEVIDLISVEEDCNVWLDPTPINVSTAVEATLVNGVVDFEIRPINIELDISQLHIEDCTFEFILDLIEVLDDILGFFGFDIYDMIADAAEPLVENQINALLPQLETTLEGAFSALTIETTVPLGDSELEVRVDPSVLEITPEGMRLGLGGSFAPSGPPAACISRYSQAGSLATPGAPPEIGAGQDVYFHMLGIYVDDDFVNQALYSVWYAGLLCFELESGSSAIELPIPIDTTLLTILAPGAYNDLFPQAAPLVLATRPTQPPTANFNGEHDIGIALEGMGLDLVAELDGRMARVAGVELTADAGANLNFDDLNGLLGVDLVLDTSAFAFDVTYNDLRPETSATIASNLKNIVDVVVGSLLGDLTSGLSFPLPSISGLGLQEILIDGAGPQGEHLGLYSSIGQVSYLPSEEGCTGGCEDSGCAQGGRPGPGLLWAAPLAWLIGRRRLR